MTRAHCSFDVALRCGWVAGLVGVVADLVGAGRAFPLPRMITPTVTNPALTARLGVMRVPTSRTWARQLARGPDKSDVGPMVCVWAAPPTCMSRGLRAYQGVYAHTQRLTCECTMWLAGRYHPVQAPDNVREQPIPPGTAQNADHFAPNSAFPPFFGEVVCVLGAIPPRTVPALPPSGGGIASLELRHAGDTPTQRFAWRKTPTATSVERAAGTEGQDGAPVGGESPATAHTIRCHGETNLAQQEPRRAASVQNSPCMPAWPGLVLWTGCFEGCWLLLVVLCPLARVLVG